VIRVAAIGDVHYDRHSQNRMREAFLGLKNRADILLVAGDLTQSGAVEEAAALVHDLREIDVPVVSVLGNHDFHQDQQERIMDLLRNSGIQVLEGNSIVLHVREYTVGIMGLKGFGGGFFGACVTDFGEPETKAFARHAKAQANTLREGLDRLTSDFKFVLTHFAPIEATLLGEKREIYPFLGSYLLGEAIDSAGVHAAFHGHAHFGTERGTTKGGVPVRNVAQTVIRHAYHIYTFEQPGPRPNIERLAPASLSSP